MASCQELSTNHLFNYLLNQSWMSTCNDLVPSGLIEPEDQDGIVMFLGIVRDLLLYRDNLLISM